MLCRPRPIERFSEFSSSPVSGEERSNPHRIALGLARKEGRGDHFTGTTEAGSIGQVNRTSPLLLALLFTSWTAEARIGETAEESKKRYGEEQTLLLLQKQIDELEVSLAGIKKLFKEVIYPPEVSQRLEKWRTSSGDRESYERLNLDGVKDLAVKSAQYERFRKIKDFYRELKNKAGAERVAEVVSNKEIADFFGKKIVSYEGLGTEIEKLDKKLQWLSYITNRSGSPFAYEETIKELVKSAGVIEKTEQTIKGLKEREADLTDTSKKRSKEELKFFKDGYWIMCFLRNDKTYQIFYYRKEISSDDVMRVLANNSDEGITWESVVVKDRVVDEKEFQPLVVYHSSDGKLEGIFGKSVKSKIDIGGMRSVLIRERSSEVEPAIKKEEKGL